MPMMQLRDIALYYEIKGQGPRLCIIGGSGADLRARPGVFDSPLARQFEILSFDQRGQGRSDKPDIPYTMADYAADAAALLDALGWRHCHVMGISFGGMVAQELALLLGPRIQSLVLACTSSGGAGGASYPLHQLFDLAPDQHRRRFALLSDTRRTDAWLAANPELFQRLLDDAARRAAIGADDARQRIGLQRQLEARRRHDTFDRLPQLALPVFVCGGRYDGIASPANQQALAGQIANARLDLFEGGHQFYLQDARAFVQIAMFLQENDISPD